MTLGTYRDRMDDADIDFIILGESDFDGSRSAGRHELDVLREHRVWFAAPEDVIIKNDGLQWVDRLGLTEISTAIVDREKSD